jgi:hypothetical protein
MPYFRKRKKRPKRSLKKALILYGSLTIVCLLITGTLSFIVWTSSDFAQKKIDDTMVAEAERVLGRKLTDRDRDQIEKKFGIKITTVTINMSEKRIKDRALADKIEVYSQGKADPADIEKARKALRER